MNLTLNHKECLALYTLLTNVVSNQVFSESTADENHIKNIHERVKGNVLSALANVDKDQFKKWEALQRLKMSADAQVEHDPDYVKAKSVSDLEPIMSDDFDEVPADLPYPKKRPPSPTMPRPQKHHAKKR